MSRSRMSFHWILWLAVSVDDSAGRAAGPRRPDCRRYSCVKSGVSAIVHPMHPRTSSPRRE